MATFRKRGSKWQVLIRRKDVTEGINYGIKASRVKEFLQSNRITLKSKNDLSEKIDVGERLENATVYISCE